MGLQKKLKETANLTADELNKYKFNGIKRIRIIYNGSYPFHFRQVKITCAFNDLKISKNPLVADRKIACNAEPANLFFLILAIYCYRLCAGYFRSKALAMPWRHSPT